MLVQPLRTRGGFELYTLLVRALACYLVCAVLHSSKQNSLHDLETCSRARMSSRGGQSKRPQQFFWVSLFLLSFARACLFGIEWYFADDVVAITHYPSSSQVFDRNGVLLYEFFGDIRRIPVEASHIPESLRQATLYAEDERFFSHSGFDPIGILRALWSNMSDEQEHRQGASTLGQQLAKNTVLGRSQGYFDKAKEVLLSIAIDARFAKADILHLYLNTIPYGSNVYGVEAASRLYFGQSVDSLTIAQSATLAALPKHPSTLSPYGGDTVALQSRRDFILGKMRDGGAIDETEYQQALLAPMEFAPNEMPILAPHFVMEVRQQLEQTIGKQALEEEGLSIMTTLDVEVQAQAEQAVASKAQGLKYNRADNVGAVVLDPKTGDVLAMVGNVDYFDQAHAGNFNMTMALRQPGSTFKPLAYATLLDQKAITPATILFDTQENFGDARDPYIPRNYDGKFRGPVTVRDALAQSLNVPAVRALLIAGIDPVIDLAQDMGISSLEERERFGPSLVLGGAEVRLVELAGAYGVFANNGEFVEPHFVSAVLQGDRMYWAPEEPDRHQVIRSETAFQISSILSDRWARAPIFGPGGSLYFGERPVAVKTGTTQGYRDAWTIGFTPSVVVGVWVGNEDNHPLREGGSGAMAAAPIWRAIMESYLADTEIESFYRPEAMQLVRVQTMVGVRNEYVAPWQWPSHNTSSVRRLGYFGL